LPPVLRERYKFAQAELLDCAPFSSLIPTRGAAAGTVRKHMDMLQARQQADLIYVRAQYGVQQEAVDRTEGSFIVPGNQMYLPMLAIEFREHFRRIARRLPPSAHPRRFSSSMCCSAMQGRC